MTEPPWQGEERWSLEGLDVGYVLLKKRDTDLQLFIDITIDEDKPDPAKAELLRRIAALLNGHPYAPPTKENTDAPGQ